MHMEIREQSRGSRFSPSTMYIIESGLGSSGLAPNQLLILFVFKTGCHYFNQAGFELLHYSHVVGTRGTN